MSGTTYVPLPNDLLVRLIQRYQHLYDGYVEHAVESFLDRTEDDWQVHSPFIVGADYVWDQLVLSDGTQLRTQHKGIWKVAELRTQQFEFDGQSYSSPSKLCNAMRGGTSNNAWISLEIKRPQDVLFRLANSFRHQITKRENTQ